MSNFQDSFQEGFSHNISDGKKMGAIGYIVAVILAIVLLGLVVFGSFIFGGDSINNEFIRIHILANSNSVDDQRAKLSVRDDLIVFLTPLLADTTDVESATVAITSALDDVQAVVDQTLRSKGKNYGASISFDTSEFPLRTYGDLTLDAGIYKAIIITLGSGHGNNWWCVAFPPLCFIPARDDGSGVIQYRSKILDLIRRVLRER